MRLRLNFNKLLSDHFLSIVFQESTPTLRATLMAPCMQFYTENTETKGGAFVSNLFANLFRPFFLYQVGLCLLCSPAISEEDQDEPLIPSMSQNQIAQKNGGKKLSYAKPYCFLLPKGSPAVQCAMESVKNIVEQYAKADVHVIPVFRWWGDDYPDDPDALETVASQACNLQKAFPWMEGKNAGSIQAFVRDPIPTVQCGRPPEDPVAGCSSLCPSGSPSFSTVSEDKCSKDVSIHESGHSNCCATQCKNTEDCPPPEKGVDGGCGLCLPKGGDNAKFQNIKKYLGNFSGASGCQLTPAALDSIRAGASKNPGYVYDPDRKYKPRGKKLRSVYGKKGVKKLLKGLGDEPDEDEDSKSSRNLGSDESSPRGSGGGAGAAASQNVRTSPTSKDSPPPKTYTSEEMSELIKD